MSKSGETPARRLLRLLNTHAEIIEAAYLDRHYYVEPHDELTKERLALLRRERLVRLEPDAAGGVTVRLPRVVRHLLNITARKRRLQDVGVEIDSALEDIDLLVQEWLIADRQGDAEAADALREDVVELLDDIEATYDEQLEGLKDRISTNFGFDERQVERAREFKLYVQRLEAMSQGADDLMHALAKDEYEEARFLHAAVARLTQRFRRHGTEISRLLTDLEYYISRVRERQRLTRRSLRFMQWLRRQPANLRLPSAEARAHELGVLCRPRPLPLSAQPDFEDPLLGDTWAGIALEVGKRRQGLEQARQRVEREASGARVDSEAARRQAQERAEAERARKWDSKTWVDGFLREAVRRGKNHPEHPDVSALAFWRRRVAQASGDEVLPTLRAWVNEVMQLAFMNRPVPTRPFFDVYEIRTEPALPREVTREPVVLRDLHVRVRADVLRRRLARRQAAKAS